MQSHSHIASVLVRILTREKDIGYSDAVVIGGLDQFLASNSVELSAINNFQMVPYSRITVAEREIWVSETISLIDPSAKIIGQSNYRKTGNASPVMGLSLGSSVKTLKLYGRSKIWDLLKTGFGIETIRHLIFHFPHRHDDYSDVRKIGSLIAGEKQSLLATVWDVSLVPAKGKSRGRIVVTLYDETGNIKVTLFGQKWAIKDLQPGTEVMLSGDVSNFAGRLTFDSPVYEVLGRMEKNVHTGRIVPVYPMVAGINAKSLRNVIRTALAASVNKVEEFLPESLLSRTGLMRLSDAIARYHYPSNIKVLQDARRRLAFNELFLVQLVAQKRKSEWKRDKSSIPLPSNEIVSNFISSLPFELTSGQSSALKEVLSDIASTVAMRRLLQGDVGSGKTVVAAAAMLCAAANGLQSAIMAPTEILAEQHYLTITKLLGSASPKGLSMMHIQIDGTSRTLTIGILTGSMSNTEKKNMQNAVSTGKVDIVVGTHSLLQESLTFPNLGLVVVDEQHRFGIMQRALLQENEPRPHLLVMSATPIPRSLALVMCGDLDLSVIDELPGGRKPIQTLVEPADRRENVYNVVRKEIKKGRQAFIVFSLIDGSSAVEARAAVEEHLRLSTQVFPDLTVGLLHGRMTLKEKELVMESFREGSLQILVATAVVEVGVDVPNASVMFIDGADRFGLAQMHQFRGRVGRGVHQSLCILMAEKPGENAIARMDALRKNPSGFSLAEIDLKLRGPGDYIGTRQSGAPLFKVAQIEDSDLLALARIEATKILESDPELKESSNALLYEKYQSELEDLYGQVS